MFGSQSDSFDWDSALDGYGVTDDMQAASETLNNSQQQLDSRHALSSDESHPIIDGRAKEGVDARHDQSMAEHENLVAEWQHRTVQLLSELFNTSRQVNVQKSNWEKNAIDLSHQIHLARLKYDLSIRSHSKNCHPAGKSCVEMVSPPKGGSLANVSPDTAGYAATSAKLRAGDLARVQLSSSRADDEDGMPSRIDLSMAAAVEPAGTPIKALLGARMGGIGIACSARPPIGGAAHMPGQASTQIAAAGCSRPTRVVSQQTTQK